MTPNPRKPSLAEHVVDGLAVEMRRGELRPGDKLPTEAEVVRRFGVSRAVVREALSRLQAAASSRRDTEWAPS